ncbi:MAG TPA: hypothetical protein VEZ48_07890 [Sphingomonadaceae bacterium]|nr:hypothetical protein [Sphingomonadaceae bacterium]
MNEEEAAVFVRKSSNEQSFARYWLPYCFQRVDWAGAKWAFLPLNRNYKPLGYLSGAWVDYPDYLQTHGVKFSRDPSTITGAWVDNPSPASDVLWLYSDGAKSRLNYFARLERVMLKAKMLVNVR